MLAQYERQVAAQAPRMAQMEAELKKLKSDDQFKGMMALQGRLAAFEKENKELGSKLLQAQASSRGSQLAKAVSFSAHESFGAVPKDAGAPIAFQLPSEMSAEQRNIYELSLAAYDRFQHDLRSRLFFIESLHKWPKAETKDIDEGAPEADKAGPEPRQLSLETISDERIFDLLPQLFNPVLKLDVEAGDDAAFCLKVEKRLKVLQSEVIQEILMLDHLLNNTSMNKE